MPISDRAARKLGVRCRHANDAERTFTQTELSLADTSGGRTLPEDEPLSGPMAADAEPPGVSDSERGGTMTPCPTCGAAASPSQPPFVLASTSGPVVHQTWRCAAGCWWQTYVVQPDGAVAEADAAEAARRALNLLETTRLPPGGGTGQQRSGTAVKTVNDGYLCPGEAARLLEVCPKTVSRWANEGKIPHHRTVGGHRRFSSSSVRALVEALVRQRKPAPLPDAGADNERPG